MAEASPPRWPHLSGRIEGNVHLLPVRIYFEDTDFSGVVYHGAFVRFMERGRSDYIRALGFGHDELAAGAHGASLAFVVKHMVVDYLAPARIDDVVEVRTRLVRLTGVRMVLGQAVTRGEQTLVDAEVTVVLIDRAGHPHRLPSAMRAALEGKLTAS